MNSDEVRKYRSVERRMVDSRVRFISPSQVEGRCGDKNAGMRTKNALSFEVYFS